MSSLFRNVLVTGGAGFIASHLLDELFEKHNAERITVIDNFLTGKKKNIEKWLADPRFTFIEHDLTDHLWFEDFLELHVPDPFSLVFHMASPASPPRYQAHPVETYLVNSMVTHFLAQYVTETKGRMLFASTSEVYGDPAVHPQPENYWGNVNPNGLRSCYDESKRMGETICGVHAREFGADIRIVRIFNTYGPRMDPNDGRVVASFLKSALEHKPLEMYGEGTQTRSFCYVTDTVDGFLRYITKDGLAGETINIGNPHEFTMNQLAEMVEKISAEKLGRDVQPLPMDDPKQRQPDIHKAQRLLGWKPTIELEEGLRLTLDDFAQQLQV